MRALSFAAMAGLISGCTGIIGGDSPSPFEGPPPEILVALFDPAAQVIPLPNDLLLDEDLGLLVPRDLDDQTAAEKAFNMYLRTLDGFPTGAGARVPFSAALDPGTVNASVVRVLDLTDP